MDGIEIECTWNGENTIIAACVNEILQQEIWSSAEVVNGENRILLPLNPEIKIESICWRLTSSLPESVLQIHSVKWMSGEECILKYTDTDLIDLFYKNNYSNMSFNAVDNNVELIIRSKGDNAYCRFLQDKIDNINKEAATYQKETLFKEGWNIIIRIAGKAFIALISVLLLVLFLGKFKILLKMLLKVFLNFKRNIFQKNVLQHEKRYILIAFFIIFTGGYYIYTVCQPFRIELVYNSDKPIERMVIYQNETIYSDISDIISGNDRKLTIQVDAAISGLLINPRTTENGEILLRKVCFLNKYNIPYYELDENEAYEYLFKMATVNNGLIKYVAGEGLYYDWDKSLESVCRLGNRDSWGNIWGNLNKTTWIITFIVECIWIVLTVSMLFIMRCKDNKYKKNIIKIIMVIVSFVAAFIWSYNTLGSNVVALGMFFLLLVMWVDYKIIIESQVCFREAVGLLFLMLISFGVPLTVSHYLFGDEWLGRNSIQSFHSLLTFGRGFQSLTQGLFSFVTHDTIGIYRLGLCTQAYVFSVYIYSKIRAHTQNKTLSFIMTGVLCCSSAMVDCVAYTAINTYTLSLCMMACSLLLFEKGLKEAGGVKKIYYFGSIILVFWACHAYQLGLTVIFLFAAIDLWYTDTLKTILKYFKYICLMASGVVVYYITLYAYSILSLNNTALARGNFIAPSDIADKAKWFFLEVLPTAVSRCIAVFSGRLLFANHLFWYKLTWKENVLPFGIGLGIFTIICLTGICYKAYNEKKFLQIILMIGMLPASYGVMLILKENSYHTYYAFPLISILIFYFMEGIMCLLKACAKKYINIFLMCFLTVIVLESMIYVRDAWCSNEKIVDYVKIMLDTNNNKKRIHIYGEDFWGGHPVYGWVMIEQILEWTGRSAEDYIVTLSEREDMCNRIWGEEYDLLSAKKLIDEDIFLSHYDYDSQANEYILKDGELIGIPDGLKEIFGRTEDCLILDLNWSVYE